MQVAQSSRTSCDHRRERPFLTSGIEMANALLDGHMSSMLFSSQSVETVLREIYFIGSSGRRTFSGDLIHMYTEPGSKSTLPLPVMHESFEFEKKV